MDEFQLVVFGFVGLLTIFLWAGHFEVICFPQVVAEGSHGHTAAFWNSVINNKAGILLQYNLQYNSWLCIIYYGFKLSPSYKLATSNKLSAVWVIIFYFYNFTQKFQTTFKKMSNFKRI